MSTVPSRKQIIMKNQESELINGLEFLKGLVDGIIADGDVSPSEVNQLQDWMVEHGDSLLEKPFVRIIWNYLIPLL